MSGTKVSACTCESAQQDKIHGKGQRVKNKTRKGSAGSPPVWRCTICTKESTKEFWKPLTKFTEEQ